MVRGLSLTFIANISDSFSMKEPDDVSKPQCLTYNLHKVIKILNKFVLSNLENSQIFLTIKEDD